MAAHGGEHGGGHTEHKAAPAGGGHGTGIGKALFGAMEQTIDKLFAEPMAQVGLDAVEGVGKVVQQGSVLGKKPAGGGGGHGGGGHSAH